MNRFLSPSRKLILLLLILSILILKLSAQESEQNNQIFVKNNQSVFFVSRSVRIDESKLKYIDLFKKLEKAMDVEILNQYIPVATGTAFLINPDGYCMTAAHVLRYQERGDDIEVAMWVFKEYILKKCVPGYLSSRELQLIFNDYVSAITDSDFVITIKTVDKEDYQAEVINKNQSEDLALLKISLNKRNITGNL